MSSFNELNLLRFNGQLQTILVEVLNSDSVSIKAIMKQYFFYYVPSL